MTYTESGECLVRCQRCGEQLAIGNYFSAIKTKYCKRCAADVKRMQIAGYMREKRAKAAERRRLEHERAKLLADENAALREEVRNLKARLAVMK